jgi:hypothetical protein
MIEYQIEKNRSIIRQALKEARAAHVEATDDAISKTLKYFERDGDTEILRGAMKERFARYIDKDEATGGFEVYTSKSTTVALDQGFYETVNSGIGAKICKARKVFSNPTAYYEYAEEGVEEEDDYKDIEKTINQQRRAGDYKQALDRADYIACAVETGPLLVNWSGGHLTYTPCSPSCVHITYGDKVIDNGEERGPDYTSIEDAIRVVIELNTLVDTAYRDQRQYLAIYGRSPEWLLGRYVVYRARNWKDVPPPSDDPRRGVFDWRTISGEIANPLSWLAATNNSDAGIEYPIVLISGGNTLSPSNAIPVSTSLFENVLEIDIALSRCLKDSLSNALGVRHITSPHTESLPRCLEGTVVTYGTQTFQLLSGDAAGSQVALEVTKNIGRAMAEGYGVPGYQLFSEGATVPESGIALYLRSQPLREHWEERSAINQGNLQRLFEIERGLYQVHTGVELAGAAIQQIWHPGRFMLPESPTDKLARISAALKEKMIDRVRAIMEYHDLPTIDAAKKYIEEMQARESEFPAPTEQPTGIGAMLNRLPTRQPKKELEKK